MSGLWNTAKSLTTRAGTRRIQRQQWNDADDTELRKLASKPPQYVTDGHDTSYRPDSIRSQDIDFIDAGKSHARGTKRYTQGWRFGAINCAISASVVFLVNFVATIWGSQQGKDDGGVFYEGDCERVRQMNTGLHFLINLLSTILLSSSNYCMQCLSAPTRKEIDHAHARGKWLDIGVPSIHNLTQISRKRTVLWALLGLSSLPLHLFYNSAVFSSISSNNYYAITVREAFVETANFTDAIGVTNSSIEPEVRALHEMARNGTLERLSNADCISAYAEMIQTGRRNVLVVANPNEAPISNFSNQYSENVYLTDIFHANDAGTPSMAMDSYSWICSAIQRYRTETCLGHLDQIRSNPDAWRVGDINGYYYEQPDRHTASVGYCLSEKAEPHCKLQFTLPIAILVTILNAFKAGLIFYIAFGTKEEPLMTMGDAVASFLEKEDPTTKDMCLLSVKDVKKYKAGYFPAGPRQWRGTKRRWKDATSHTRRAVTLIMFTIALSIVAFLLSLAVRSLPDGQARSLPALARLGYGAIDPRTIITFPGQYSITQNVLIANIAQPILSFLYFSYNGIFTAMLLGFEWFSYAHRSKGLRVSRAPTGAQRSTYFLQLPYRFALPLMGLSGILHWLVSQSIFLVAIDVYDWDGSRVTPSSYGSDGDWKSCGYSPIAIVSVLILGIFMVFGVIGFGFIPYKTGMPLAGSCSAAISAACHKDEGDDVDGYTTAVRKLKWGVVSTNEEGVGHCAFSTKEVELPREWGVYAG